MKYTSIQNKELVISHIDSNVSISKIIIELGENLNSTTCYFKKDIWLNLLSELHYFTNISKFINYDELKFLEFYSDLWGDYFEISTTLINIDYHGTLNVPYLQCKKPKNINDIFAPQHLDFFSSDIKLYFRYWLTFLNRRRSDLKILNELSNYREIISNAIFNENYLKNLKRIKWIDKLVFLEKCLNNSKLQSKYFENKTLVEQIEISTTIKKQIKKYGNRILKLLIENNIDEINDENIRNLILGDFLKNQKIMCTPLIKKPILKGGWQCVQLITHFDLFNESEYQGHCIGGYRFDYYSSEIKKDNLKAFSLRKNDKWITVTFKRVGVRWEIDEYQTSCKDDYKIYESEYDKSVFELNLEIILKCLKHERYKIEDDEF